MNRVVMHHDRRPAAGGGYRVVVALLLVGGASVGWRIVPPDALGGGARPGPHALAVTLLVMAPLALLAAAGGAWLAGRQGWPARGTRGLLTRAAATAGLFALLSLVTAPVQRAAFAWLSPVWGPPNLAAIRYDSATVEQAHEAMQHHDGVSPAEQAVINAPFYPSVRGGFSLDYAMQDALFLFAVGAPLVILGLFLTARLTPRTAPRHAAVLIRFRPRWTAAAAGFLLAAAGVVVIAPAAGAAVTPFSLPLRIPPVLSGSDVTLQMRQADVQIMPSGPPTRMWTYNGIFPGPTIRRPSGTTTRVTFRNDLPPSFGEATIHHHGSHSTSTEDGQPNSQLIPPGAQRTYTYRHVEDGRPERAVTQWYHDHRMDVTGRNVWNGLAGFFILDDAVDSALPLPKGEFDVPLMIADRTFDANNQIPYNFNILGTQGDTFLVDGVPQPFFDVGDRKYRFRVLNASNRTPLILALSNGAPLTQIGTDAGLLPAPVSRTQILIQPAERVEVVVDFAGLLGQNVNLINANPVAIPPPELMQFRVTRDLVDNSSVPTTLRPAPTFPAPVRDRQFVIATQNDAAGNIVQWQFNGQPFDSARIDADPVLGTTERWTFLNNSPQPHAIHLHDVDWRLVSRFNLAFDDNGNPIPGTPIAIPPYEDGLKETFSLLVGQGFSVVTTFTDNTGPYMFHCHMLEHEDMALMAQFNVHT